MAIIKERASNRIKTFYNNAMRKHTSLSRDAVKTTMQTIRNEMKALDNSIPSGCHVVKPSYLTLWNDNSWIDVSSHRTKWHYAYTHNETQAIIHDAEHSNNMSDSAMRPINEALQRIFSLMKRMEKVS